MGVMDFSKIALKNLFSKPATESYPFAEREYPERYRGKVAISIDDCIMCGMCMRKCPASAITVNRETKTWEIQRMSCVQCAYCVQVCPKKCLSMEQHYTEPSAEKTVDTFSQPIVEEPKPENKAVGGKPSADLNSCVFCTLCAKNCPAGALTVDRAEKKWELNEAVCVECGLCATKCPKKCISMGGAVETTIEKAYEPEVAKENKVESKPSTGLPSADLNTCVFCTLCAKNCPAGALKVDRTEKTWEIDENACIGCGLCANQCPKHCIEMN